MIVNLLSPVALTPPSGYFGAATLGSDTETILLPGEVDGDYLMRGLGAREFSHQVKVGAIVPIGCRQHHAKIVLYGAVHCFECGWIV